MDQVKEGQAQQPQRHSLPRMSPGPFRFPLRRILFGLMLAVLLCVATLLLRLGIGFSSDDPPMLVLYMIPVIASSYAGGLWAGLFCTGFAGGLAAYFLLPPIQSFKIDNLDDLLNLGTMLLTGAVISILVESLHRMRLRVESNYERYRIVADNTYDWEFWISPDGRSLYQSPSCMRITGYDAGAFLAEPDQLLQIVHPDDLALFMEHRHGVVNEQSPGTLQFRIIRPDGEVRWIEHFCRPVFGREGVFLGSRGSNSDITERKKAEQFREDVEHIIRHDIKSPLSGLYGLTQLVLDNASDDETREAAPQILHAIRNVIRLVDASDKLIRMEQGRYSPQAELFDLRNVMRNIEMSLDSLIHSKKVCLTQDEKLCQTAPLKPPLAFGEEFLIEDMLTNLVKNAVEASPTGGEVVVSFCAEEDGLRIAIHNMGAVPESVRHKFFEKYSTAGKAHGTGLGTYSARLVAKAHGGHIEFASSEKEGTTVTVVLPGPPSPS